MKKRKKLSAVLAVALLASLIPVTSFAEDKDDWYIHYISNAPSPISVGSASVDVTYYGAGFRAKATTLSGSFDRYVDISGRDGTIVNPDSNTHTIMITTSGVLTSVFETGGGYSVSHFVVYGHGTYNCDSTGWIYINSANVYNS